MLGDTAPLREMVEVKREAGAWLWWTRRILWAC
jgi:7-keto-8-aminopelargonate synthetase-like enzyme